MKRLGMLQHMSFVALAAMTFTAACGDDDDGGTPDARRVDAPIGFDAPPTPTFDARPPDAQQADAGPTFSATMAVHDVEVFGTGGTFHGLQLTIGASQNGAPTVMSISTGSPIGCTASIVDVTVPAQNPPDVNEGTVKITITPSAGAANVLPDCTLTQGAYRCIRGGGTAGTLAAATMNADKIITFTNTTSGATAFDASAVGAYLVIPAAEKAFPITGVSGTSAGLQLVATPPASPVADWFIQYGFGPQQYSSAPDGSGLVAGPDLLPDDATATIQLVPGGGNHIAAYTSGALNAGDRFDLDAPTTGFFTNGIDLDGTADLTFACTGTGCSGPGANATILNIETTDTAGGGPGELLPPTQFRGEAQCNNAFSSSVVLKAEAIALLKQAGARKMRISFFRDNADIAAATGRGLSVAVGHGIVTFKDVPAPTKPQ